MNQKPRRWLIVLAGTALALALAQRAVALNPQPEVPSKQPGKTNPRALNPQPEVPSKEKQKKSKAADKKKQTKTQAQQ
jgi:hypothetical protein